MIVRIAIFIFILSTNILPGQTALNMELYSQFNRGDTRYSGSWAYIDSQGNEYALLGARTGTAAYSIDNPVMTELGFISGPASNWREITVIGNQAYVTTEGSSDSTGMQVIDLQYLPDSLHLRTTYDLTFTKGHILQRDNYSDAPYVYVNGTQETDGVHILDVSDPSNPVEIGLYEPGYYIHDCFVKGDLLFAAAFYVAKMDILDISDKTNPVLVGQIDHFDGNTHSSWVTEDDRFLMITSELDGKPARIYNIEDLNNITEVSTYTASPLSLVHNPYIRGNFAFVSHNTEGIRVVDLYDPEVPVEVGYYDTWDGASGGFHGLWSACPFFPSGKIIGGNREDGLYVWTFNDTKAGRIYATILDSLSLEPLSNTIVTILETNDTLLTDANGQVKWGALPGTYTLSVEKNNYLSKSFAFSFSGCDTMLVDVLLQTDIVENTSDIFQNLPEIILSPNPSNGKINLDATEWEQGSSLHIFNAIGQRVYAQQIGERSVLQLDLSFLRAGIFHVLLVDRVGQPLARSRLVLFLRKLLLLIPYYKSHQSKHLGS